MYRIYNVTKKDLQGILRLLKKCNLDFKRKISDLEKARKINDVFLVCKNENKIMGTVRAIFDGYYCMLFDLAVNPHFRNYGVGATHPKYIHMSRYTVPVYNRNIHKLCKHRTRKEELDCCEEFCMERITVGEVFNQIRLHV